MYSQNLSGWEGKVISSTGSLLMIIIMMMMVVEQTHLNCSPLFRILTCWRFPFPYHTRLWCPRNLILVGVSVWLVSTLSLRVVWVSETSSSQLRREWNVDARAGGDDAGSAEVISILVICLARNLNFHRPVDDKKNAK
jgi:hypothetical protein